MTTQVHTITDKWSLKGPDREQDLDKLETTETMPKNSDQLVNTDFFSDGAIYL
jgi:hypothetical protein